MGLLGANKSIPLLGTYVVPEQGTLYEAVRGSLRDSSTEQGRWARNMLRELYGPPKGGDGSFRC